MTIYVAIDEGYCFTKLSSISSVLNHAKDYYTKDGKRLDRKTAKVMLNEFGVYLYEYSPDELYSIRSGVLLRRDWDVKIQLL